MALDDDIYSFYRQRDWPTCHRLLDEASPGSDDDARHSIAHWRAAVFEGEGRYREALELLETRRDDFFCKTDVHHERARILDHIGETAQALEELQSAPFDAERDQFPPVVLDAVYFHCFLLAKTRHEVPDELLRVIPDDFRYIQFGGKRTTKGLLTDMISEGAPGA